MDLHSQYLSDVHDVHVWFCMLLFIKADSHFGHAVGLAGLVCLYVIALQRRA